MMRLSRREVLLGLAAAATSAPAAEVKRWPVCAFSKHFQWTSIEDTARICKQIGYDGVDLTVRAGGHVEPERVEQDLPRAIETLRAEGLETPMVTAGIVDAASPHAEAIVRTLAKLGIRRYRWGGFKYTDGAPLKSQIAEFRRRTVDLAALNKHHGVSAMYHTHSGPGQVGASFWDLEMLFDGLDADAVSVNYDIGHATVEGGYGGWLHSTRLLVGRIRGIALKDFVWEKNAQGEWTPGWCAFGRGMVPFRSFLERVKSSGFSGPLQLHYEYPELGGPNDGKPTSTVSRARLIEIFQRDLDACRRVLRGVGIV